MTPAPAFEFKGWDWTEILEAVGVDTDAIPPGPNDANHRALMDERILGCLDCGEVRDSDEARAFVAARRAHVAAIASHGGNEAPVWEGLARVEHDWTFMQFVRDLYTRMWT